MDNHNDIGNANSAVNDSKNNQTDIGVNLKGFSTAFKTVHDRKGGKIVKLLKNRKKVNKSNQIVNAEAQKQARLIRKHRESIRQKPADYDVKSERVLKSIAKKGGI